MSLMRQLHVRPKSIDTPKDGIKSKKDNSHCTGYLEGEIHGYVGNRERKRENLKSGKAVGKEK